VFCIVGVNDTELQEHYDEFFEEVFTELEEKVSSVCSTFVVHQNYPTQICYVYRG